MNVVPPLRRLGLATVAVAASAVIVAGCSTSTSGKPFGGGGVVTNAAATGGGAASSAGGGNGGGSSAAGGGSSSLPASTQSSFSIGGGSKSDFCKQLGTLSSDLSSPGSAGVADKFEELAKIAPPDIKPDVQLMADYLQSALSGTVPSADKTQAYIAAGQKLGQYLVNSCS